MNRARIAVIRKKYLKRMAGKREKCSEPENLREGLGPTAEGAAEDSGQKLKQHDLSVSVTLEKT